jgi:hypothetical protein
MSHKSDSLSKTAFVVQTAILDDEQIRPDKPMEINIQTINDAQTFQSVP